jgi:hypothetical protein
MPAARSYDVVFAGAGHNALVAAAYLAKAGRSVCLLDRGPVPGGWVRSEELTLPGFVHDTYSALHPSFAHGPVLSELGAELTEHGLRYVQGPVSTAASLPDGRTAVIDTDPDTLAEELDRLGERGAWAQLATDMGPHLASLIPLLGMDLTSPQATALLATLRRDGAETALPYATLLTGTGHDLVRERFRSAELHLRGAALAAAPGQRPTGRWVGCSVGRVGPGLARRRQPGAGRWQWAARRGAQRLGRRTRWGDPDRRGRRRGARRGRSGGRGADRRWRAGAGVPGGGGQHDPGPALQPAAARCRFGAGSDPGPGGPVPVPQHHAGRPVPRRARAPGRPDGVRRGLGRDGVPPGRIGPG